MSEPIHPTTDDRGLPFIRTTLSRAYGGMQAVQDFAPKGTAAAEIGQECLQAIQILDRLSETLNYPRLTLTAPVEQITAVLKDWEKGRPVNTQDLINALAWRLGNQRREIAKLNEALRRKTSDEAPSFSPNFDERNNL